MSYMIFEIAQNRGCASVGTQVQRFPLSDQTTVIGAVVVGESGRGRQLGVVPVAGDAPGERGMLLTAASLGQTRASKPRLIPADSATDHSAALVVFRTPIGFRGSNNHTGDRAGTDPATGKPTGFLPFPGTVLAQGIIAQGDAGHMGSGVQLVALVPRGSVFRVVLRGRLYGAPDAHYYVFDGQQIRGMTWDERVMIDPDPLRV
jgi:hypothetical protein